MLWWSKQPTESQQQSYQQQIKWQYPEQPVSKSWAIEIRDYDTKSSNWIYVIGNLFILLLFGSITLAVAKPPEYIVFIIGFGIGFLLLHGLIYSFCFSKKFVVYRFTHDGFEVAAWDSHAEGVKKIFISVAIICSVIVLFIVILVPQAFFLLFIGPGGMILTMLTQTTNKQVWEQQKDYSQKYFDWDLFTEILLYKKRHILTLFIDVKERNKRLDKYSNKKIIHIFCYPDSYQTMIEFIQSKVNPNTPCKEGHIELYPDECC